MTRRGYRTIKLPLKKEQLSVYSSPRVADALEEIKKDMTLYHGVRFTQILDAVYQQGKKDGAAEVFEKLMKDVKQLEKEIPHRRPGRPSNK